MPWHNGKVERSHRNNQRYFYDWEKFSGVEELNEKLKVHLAWSNRKPMRNPWREKSAGASERKAGRSLTAFA